MDGFKLYGVTFVDTSKFFEYGTTLATRKIPSFVVNYDKFLLIGGKKNAVFELSDIRIDNEIPNNYVVKQNFEQLTDIIFIYADNMYLYFLRPDGTYNSLIIYDVFKDTYITKQTPIPTTISDKTLRYVKPLKLFDGKILLSCMYSYNDYGYVDSKQYFRMFLFDIETQMISNILTSDNLLIQFINSTVVADQISSMDVVNFSSFSIIYFYSYLTPVAYVLTMLYSGDTFKVFKNPSNGYSYLALLPIVGGQRGFSNNLVYTLTLFYNSSHYSCNRIYPINYTQTSSGDIIEFISQNIYNTYNNLRISSNSSTYVTAQILNTFKFKINISKLEFYDDTNVSNTVTQTISINDLYSHYQFTGDTTYTYYEPTVQSLINNGSTSLYLGFEFGNDYIFKGTDLIEFKNYISKETVQLNKGSDMYFPASDILPTKLKNYLNRNYISDLFTENYITASDGTVMKGNMWHRYLFPSCNIQYSSNKLGHNQIFTKIKTVRETNYISLFPSSPLIGYINNKELQFGSPIKTYNQINRISVMPRYMFYFLQNDGHINRYPVIIYQKSYII